MVYTPFLIDFNVNTNMDLKASVNMFKLSKKTKNVKFLFSKCDQLDKYGFESTAFKSIHCAKFNPSSRVKGF